MSKSSGSTDLTGKADDNKVYDSTDADGFPTSSIDIAKSGEALPSGEDSCQSNDKIGAQKEDKLDDGPEIKAFVSQQPEMWWSSQSLSITSTNDRKRWNSLQAGASVIMW